jgi:hypothetical protein
MDSGHIVLPATVPVHLPDAAELALTREVAMLKTATARTTVKRHGGSA